jgi:asparagine synthase (glutamine-hydrolysing)
MCGICGKFVFSGQIPEEQLIAKMARTLKHRGPDDQKLYTAPYIGLGQTRLSIIDLAPGATAPLCNEDRTIWVVFNGEIYNFQTLRDELLRRNHRFRTKTDTEVIVHAYEEYGLDCLSRFRGMFAFALWDAQSKRLFAARDRLGKKPFCYHRSGSEFTFASEIKAITADPAISVIPNFPALDKYLTYQYVPSPLTAFVGIERLPAAHYLTCDVSGEVRVERYWSPNTVQSRKFRDPTEAKEEIRQQLREAVRLRLNSDVPLAAFLSGGVDSSIIVGLMAELSDRPVTTITVGFEEGTHDERDFARIVSDHFGTDHREYSIRPDAMSILPKLVWHYNEPFADPSAVPTYLISQLAHESVKVCLTGDGGDEAFAGYGGYTDEVRWARWDVIPKPLRRLLALGASDALDLFPHQRFTARASRALRMVGSTVCERHDLHMMLVKPQERRALYSSRMCDLITGNYSPTLLAEAERSVEDVIQCITGHDLSHYLPDCLMVKTDIASMANSLEIRSPMLDHKFIEFTAGLPSSLKHNGHSGKQILRDAFRGLVPSSALSRKKQGFGIPLGSWFRAELLPLLRDSLLGDKALKRRLFNHAFVSRMIDEHVAGRRDWSNRLWALLFLELWFERFID